SGTRGLALLKVLMFQRRRQCPNLLVEDACHVGVKGWKPLLRSWSAVLFAASRSAEPRPSTLRRLRSHRSDSRKSASAADQLLRVGVEHQPIVGGCHENPKNPRSNRP